MYTIATTMFGLGTGGSIGQVLVEKRQQRVVLEFRLKTEI